MESLEAELDRARELDVDALADAVESIGFECTRCGACCKAVDGCGDATGDAGDSEGTATGDAGDSGDAETGDAGDDGDAETGTGDAHDHVATVFPDEVRRLQAAAACPGDEPYDWRDVARPMPWGLREESDGRAGETFEWSLATDDCGDCRFYAEDDGTGRCTVHADRPLVCRTYPFSVALGGTSQPMGEAVDGAGMVRAHECEGLGRDISREDAEELAAALKERAVRELEEAIAVRENYEPVGPDADGVVVHDSEGAKRPDGTPYE
ncbi:MAG: YkgJ family cysteine cluster protein [Haloarculaceae archaeon]